MIMQVIYIDFDDYNSKAQVCDATKDDQRIVSWDHKKIMQFTLEHIRIVGNNTIYTHPVEPVDGGFIIDSPYYHFHAGIMTLLY